MPIVPMEADACLARRDLRREEMVRFGEEIAWLTDPSLIPEQALNWNQDEEAGLDNPYTGLGHWMVDSMAHWSIEHSQRLSYGEVFDKHELDSDSRVALRQVIREKASEAYRPGIDAISEIFEVVPAIATREGLGPETWLEIAQRSKKFGLKLTHDGTHTQALTRLYLKKDGWDVLRLRPELFTLDSEGSITTVTPIDDLLNSAAAASRMHIYFEEHSGICVALQAPMAHLDGKSMFDAFWDAYGFGVAKFIYPKHQVDPSLVTRKQEPDPNFSAAMDTLAARQAEYMAESIYSRIDDEF